MLHTGFSKALKNLLFQLGVQGYLARQAVIQGNFVLQFKNKLFKLFILNFNHQLYSYIAKSVAVYQDQNHGLLV